ncbi:TIGR02099 family protein [Erwinia sp. OLTSP20]|uniref:AsmA2 domain-containing protein YhdP n=1 Tax=unclassified Erwinia TaxID=2622719 RepID=UPI000C19690D|nr:MULTISPECIES: AsmA2 domain-containing protein YhdP [unclassified Erwinia]PIJ51077.1 TIGR02099 family protein [Erwinia sp. OAMSP11]PIJ73655.1 TIGR02099 family protein [Erwinia sp. OLSSP12]PIJ83012.1 TIGR02099 family protein [Erwinia sp. OLCASP19]PIJ85611.1 TIGR02099 family protein [Erwinia sp. OLMTSP26]PIJ87740.1 TIGR02099 family protein [Erwinia sp. OLMDSP33]
MRQPPRILLLTCAAIIVIVALMVSALRLAMPMLNSWRQPILHTLSSLSGLQINASELNGRWENFGPSLTIHDVQVAMKDGGELKISRVNLALNIWQSLLHGHWQFRDLTFYQLNLKTNTPLTGGDDDTRHFQRDHINELFLRQFDHFILRDSQLSFPAPSGQRLTLAMPSLTWFNEENRHRAEGEVSLSSLNGQHGVLQVRMDLRDSNGLLNNGRIWMQADDVDVRPWLGQWIKDHTTLQKARFSLAAWVNLKDGDIYDGDLWLRRGGASWQGIGGVHTLQVDNQTAHFGRINSGWQLSLPQTHLMTDGKAWQQGRFDVLWQPENNFLPGPAHAEELRIRATKLDLASLEPLIPLVSRLSPQLMKNWQQLQPRGQLETLALDIPLSQPERTRFQARWKNLSWHAWQLLPEMQKLNGELSGSVANGQLYLSLPETTVNYQQMFKAPLQINAFSGRFNWQYGAQGLNLSGEDLDVQALALSAHGNFRFEQPTNGAPHLAILSGISVSDARQAWRYFPQPLMGKSLVDYLTAAIQGGNAENATLLFSGDPGQFPFKHHEGMFEVAVPLRNATFAFQPDWPAIANLAIDLDFINDGLWMNAPQAMLGKVQATNVSATIPDYSKERLLIDGDLRGQGADVSDYFNQSALREQLGTALKELPIGGEVSSRLHLDIPLDHRLGIVRATGDVMLQNNSLTIKPVGMTLNHLSGRFRFNNGSLDSEPMRADWLGQPLDIRFNTREGASNFTIGVDLAGNWQPGALAGLPPSLKSALKGSAAWQSKVAVDLPHQGHSSYKVSISSDLKGVSSYLPSPLDKKGDRAFPVEINASGDIHQLTVSGRAGRTQFFNSRWLLTKPLRIERGVWLTEAKAVPPLPASAGMVLNLPALDGDSWLSLLRSHNAATGSKYGSAASHSMLPATLPLPENLKVSTPLLKLAGQQWHALTTTFTRRSSAAWQVQAKGQEIDGTLLVAAEAPWDVNLQYLYYNPQWPAGNNEASPLFAVGDRVDFSRWPALRINCQQCWLRGQNFGQIQARLAHSADTLTLSQGIIDTGKARLQINGEWVNRPENPRTSLQGKLSGKNINDAINWFGVDSPVRNASFNIDYDLHWRSAPWQPSVPTLSGTIKTQLGSGEIADVSTGRAGQILRLFSVDALLRKLRLDFSDSFSQGFSFDAIDGSAWIENGVMHTNNLLVDGLEADIAMQGSVDLVKRQLNMEAVVAPEISTTVGVATAFAVNPVVGAAVFAASKVLGPLWSKISVLRYHISGPLDKPKIDEILRQNRSGEAK